MKTTPSPSRAKALDTSPPLREGEDRSETSAAGCRPLPPAGGEVSSPEPVDGRDGEGARSTSRSRRSPGTTNRARSMRRNGTKAEALLWTELKAKRLGGFHFTRQFPIGPYFADFACRTERLVVEVDGSQHASSSRDRMRDAFMRSAGTRCSVSGTTTSCAEETPYAKRSWPRSTANSPRT